MATQVQNRRGSTAEHGTFTGAVGELTVDTDKDVVVVHDGTTAGGHPMLKQDLSNLPAGTIDNADVSASAAIAGTKISPNFGSQNTTTTGTSTAASFIPTSSTAPTNGLYLSGTNTVGISTGGTGRLFVDASGRVGIGGSPGSLLEVSGSGSAAEIRLRSTDTTNAIIRSYINSLEAGKIAFTSGRELFIETAGTERARIRADGMFEVKGAGTAGSSPAFSVSGSAPANSCQLDSSGRLLVGTTSSSAAAKFILQGNTISGTAGGLAQLQVGSTTPADGDTLGRIDFSDSAGYQGAWILSQRDGGTWTSGSSGPGRLVFSTTANGSANPAPRMTIDSSGRLLVGTSSAFTGGDQQYARIQIVGNAAGASGAGLFAIGRGEAATSITVDERIGSIGFSDNGAGEFGRIECIADGTAGAGDYPGRLVFSTTADGAASPTERMRITNAGDVIIGKAGVSISYQNPGISLLSSGTADFTRASSYLISCNRKTDDGALVEFYQDNALEGTISVSGTTVSYNGAHLSRWSQLPGGAVREEILRGTVLSNIDEMCGWGDEDNEQLNRMQVSDVEGDPNVSGVFQDWDDDDDTYTDDFYCAMTGDFIIRISAGIPVHRGQLLMSAGDGTAKPQDDDIVRSKTIAKVTSNHVTCTYDDGSYCVPCVLMAC